MNLLVKKMGLVLLPALFFACEEPTEIGASLNPNSGALSTHYVELPVSTSQVRFDSLNTALRLTAQNTLLAPYLGRVENADFGALKAVVYANMAAPNDSTITLGTQARLDSAVIKVVWRREGLYGTGFNQVQRYTIHQLGNPIVPTRRETTAENGVEAISYNYISGSKQTIADQIGEFTLDLAYVADKIDTAKALNNVANRTLSYKLPTGAEDFASRIFRDFKSNPLLHKTQAAFEEYFKGIAIVPAEENSYLISLDVAATGSGSKLISALTLYYTQGTQQYELILPFVPADRAKRKYTNTFPYNVQTSSRSYPLYYGLEAERSGTGLANMESTGHLQEFDPLDGRVYFQSLSGLLPKIEFHSFKDFMLSKEHEADEQIVFNRAILEFDSLLAGEGRQPLPLSNGGTQLYFVDDADGTNRGFVTSSPVLRGGLERAFSTAGASYRVGENTTVNIIQADIVHSLEQFNQNGQDRYLESILYPGDAHVFSPNRFVIRANQVKLKIWYTKLKGSSL